MWNYLRNCKRCGECYEALSKFGKICSKCSQKSGGRYSAMRRRKEKMATIKEEAQAFVPKQTRNIAELKKTSVDLEIKTKICKEGTSDEFVINITTIDGEDYRIPDTVLGQLKEHLVENDDMEYFKVKKTGEGLKTSYTVIPILK